MALSFEIKDFDTPIVLEQPIDNRTHQRFIKVTSVIYWVGYYNVPKGEKIKIRTNELVTDFPLEPGLYNFQQLKDAVNASTGSVTMDLNRKTGRVKISVVEGQQLKLSGNLAGLLNMDLGWLSGENMGRIDFQPFKAIYLHCDQISASDNFFNGKPSNLLEIIPVGDKPFGSSVHFDFSNKVNRGKHLIPGVISEFKFSIKDSTGRLINNHGLPFILTLEMTINK